MLSNFEIGLYSLVVILLPLVAYGMVTGAPPPENTWLSKYYRAEKYLHPVGNIFLLTLCANTIVKLARHFGYVPPVMDDRIAIVGGTFFFLMFVAFLVLWIRAYLKVRRAGKDARTA
jgi:hypothetical protein